MRTYRFYLTKLNESRKNGNSIKIDEENFERFARILAINLSKTHFIGQLPRSNRESISILNISKDEEQRIIHLECGIGREGSHPSARSDQAEPLDISNYSAETEHHVTFLFDEDRSKSEFLTIIESDGLINPRSRIDSLVKSLSETTPEEKKLYPKFTQVSDLNHFKEVVNHNDALLLRITAEGRSPRGKLLKEKKIIEYKINNDPETKSELISISQEQDEGIIERVLNYFGIENPTDYSTAVIKAKDPNDKQKTHTFNFENTTASFFSYPLRSPAHCSVDEWIHQILSKSLEMCQISGITRTNLNNNEIEIINSILESQLPCSLDSSGASSTIISIDSQSAA